MLRARNHRVLKGIQFAGPAAISTVIVLLVWAPDVTATGIPNSFPEARRSGRRARSGSGTDVLAHEPTASLDRKSTIARIKARRFDW